MGMTGHIETHVKALFDKLGWYGDWTSDRCLQDMLKWIIIYYATDAQFV